MRHAGDELTDGRQLFGLEQLRLRRFQLVNGGDELRVGDRDLIAHLAQTPRAANFLGHVFRDLDDRRALRRSASETSSR